MTWHEYALAWAGEYGGCDPRRAPRLSRAWHRAGYYAGQALAGLGVRPVVSTVAGLGLAFAVPVAAASGPAGLVICAVLVVSSALAACCARALAVLDPPPVPNPTAADRPAVSQTVADRLAEMAWLAGFWLAGVPGWLVVACLGLTGLHEYVRDRIRAHRRAGRVRPRPVSERVTRVWLAVTGLTLAGLAGLLGGAGRQAAPGLLTVAAAAWALVALVGLGQVAEARRP